GEIQKFLGDLHANGVLAHVFWPCSAIAIAIKSRHRIAATTFQFRSQNIRRHRQLSVTIGGNFTGEKNECQSARNTCTPIWSPEIGKSWSDSIATCSDVNLKGRSETCLLRGSTE